MENINQIGGYEKGTISRFQIYENHHPDQHEIAFFPSSPNHLINANDGGVFIEDYFAEDVVWTSLNNGYYSTQLYTATINDSGQQKATGGFQDNGTFTPIL